MDENNNGPVPGIIGQDVPSEESVPTQVESTPKQDGGKIFDNSSFTGEEPQSLSFNANGETKQEKKKGPNPFTKWQLWAILSGVISLAFIATVVIMSIVYDGKIKNVEAVAQYDAAVGALEDNKASFEDSFKKELNSAYNILIGTPSSTSIYPENDQILQIKNSCLGKYGLSEEDIKYVDEIKTGADLYSDGQNVLEAKERVEQISSSYSSASQAVESCRDDMLSPVTKNLEISIAKVELSEPYQKYTFSKENWVKVSQIVTIKNKGQTTYGSITLSYDILDRNGVSMRTRSITTQSLKPGDSVELDLYRTYETTESDAKTIEGYKPKLVKINGYTRSN